MPYQVSMMGWVRLGRVKTFVGWVGSRNFGLCWVLKKWPMTNSVDSSLSVTSVAADEA